MPQRLIPTLLAVLLLAACHRGPHPAGQGDAEPPLLQTQWRLATLGDQAVELAEDRRPDFTLDAKENRISGFTGCNRMSGEYVLSGSELKFDRMISTKMACVETMELERDFLNAMQATAGWRMAEGRLELLDAGGALLAGFDSVTPMSGDPAS